MRSAVAISERVFKFQYDNTLSTDRSIDVSNFPLFKFQYDNTLRTRIEGTLPVMIVFKFQYDNTLSQNTLQLLQQPISYLNSNMIIL